MADRIHIWHYIIKEDGEPMENADIRLYLSGTTTEANIYLTKNSANYTTCRNADLKTNNDGYVEFWLAGDWESGGHAFTQLFKLEWYKAGTAPGYIEDYNPWPNTLIWRDTNSSADRDYRNKFVSDQLANKWLTHVPQIVPSASPHDLQPVDYESGCDDDIYDKVVSNKMLNDILLNCYASDSVGVSGNTAGHSETITSWSTIGSQYYKDISHPTVDNDSCVILIDINTLEQIMPAEVIYTGTNTTRVIVEENNDMRVTIHGSI